MEIKFPSPKNRKYKDQVYLRGMDSGIGIGGLSTGKEEYVTSAFDLFTSTEVENSIQKAHHLTYRPISVTAGAGPFNFEIPADPEKFTDAESIQLVGLYESVKKI